MKPSALIDVIAKHKGKLFAFFVPTDGLLDGTLLNLRADGADFVAYEVRGQGDRQEEKGWGLVATRPPKGFKLHSDQLNKMGLGEYMEIPSSGVWALVAVLGKAFEKLGPGQFHASERWADQAARKVPTNALPDHYLDLPAARVSRN